MTTRQKPAASPAAPTPATPRDTHGLAQAHEIHVVDGRFAHAECTCGWRSAGRRLRSTARAEGRDHALLYAAS